MKFEDLQNQWQKEGGKSSLEIDYDVLFKEVKRNKSYFEAMVFWRDVREVGVGLGLVVFFLYFGIKDDVWPLYLLSYLCLFVSLFIVIDRICFKKSKPHKEDSLRDCVENSVAEVNHQIWLLRNVFWWYLLPPTIGLIVFFSSTKIHRYTQRGLLEETTIIQNLIWPLLGEFLLLVLVYGGVYLLNQYAVKKELRPRKQELEDLLQSIVNGSQKESTGYVRNLWMVVFLTVLFSSLLLAPFVIINKPGWEADKPVVIEITPPLLPQETAGPKKLKILSAQYGAKDQWVDVTQKVVDAVDGNTLSIHSGNELAGKDPLFLQRKTLTIECLWDGEPKTIKVPEGMDLKIPFETEPNTEQAAPKM